MGLGSVRLVPLKEARELAHRFRGIARAGGDPFEERRRATTIIPTFSEAAHATHRAYLPTWKNSKHADQWINTLTQYAFPLIGQRPVDQITSADIARILGPIWSEKPETARRLSQRLSAVIKWTRAHGHFHGIDPVELAKEGLPRQRARVNHHRGVPYNAVPGLVKQLRTCTSDPITRLAFEFLILTAARTTEVLEARWSEITTATDLWILPAERSKTARAHRVPLTERTCAILTEARAQSTMSDFVFPSPVTQRPLSNNTLLHLLQKRLDVDATVHGFRGAFKTWAAECTHFGTGVSEMALAHTIANRVEAAYQHSDLLEKRRMLMAAWDRFVCQRSEGGANVVAIPHVVSYSSDGIPHVF